jgi:hypothetical protein
VIKGLPLPCAETPLRWRGSCFTACQQRAPGNSIHAQNIFWLAREDIAWVQASNFCRLRWTHSVTGFGGTEQPAGTHPRNAALDCTPNEVGYDVALFKPFSLSILDARTGRQVSKHERACSSRDAQSRIYRRGSVAHFERRIGHALFRFLRENKRSAAGQNEASFRSTNRPDICGLRFGFQRRTDLATPRFVHIRNHRFLG